MIFGERSDILFCEGRTLTNSDTLFTWFTEEVNLMAQPAGEKYIVDGKGASIFLYLSISRMTAVGLPDTRKVGSKGIQIAFPVQTV